MLDRLAPREKLNMSTVYYQWSSIDQLYYSQILKDESFYEIVEQSLSSHSLYEAFIKFDVIRETISNISGINSLEVHEEYKYNKWRQHGSLIASCSQLHSIDNESIRCGQVRSHA